MMHPSAHPPMPSTRGCLLAARHSVRLGIFIEVVILADQPVKASPPALRNVTTGLRYATSTGTPGSLIPYCSRVCFETPDRSPWGKEIATLPEEKFNVSVPAMKALRRRSQWAWDQDTLDQRVPVKRELPIVPREQDRRVTLVWPGYS